LPLSYFLGCLNPSVRQARRQDFAAGGPKSQGDHIFKYNIGCTEQPGGQIWNGGHRF